MNQLKGKTAILTGASGGLGEYIARALAGAGMKLVLCAAPGDGLPAVGESIQATGAQADWLTVDVRVPEQRVELLARTREKFGQADLLVNNAGVEYSAVYHELTEAQIHHVVDVNLVGAMLLTRLVLPGMLARRRGHIVNISSLAGKSGPGFQEPYVAAKAGLAAFTYSLRSTYRGTGVSASVVTPGFVEAGIYARLKARSGRSAPVLLGACPPERVAQAVIKAIRHDRPEIIINRYPVRPLLALAALFPSFGAWITQAIGVNAFFRAAADGRNRSNRQTTRTV